MCCCIYFCVFLLQICSATSCALGSTTCSAVVAVLFLQCNCCSAILQCNFSSAISSAMCSWVWAWTPEYICKGILSQCILSHFLGTSTALFIWFLRLFVCRMSLVHCMSCIDQIMVIWPCGGWVKISKTCAAAGSITALYSVNSCFWCYHIALTVVF